MQLMWPSWWLLSLFPPHASRFNGRGFVSRTTDSQLLEGNRDENRNRRDRSVFLNGADVPLNEKTHLSS